jgi:hypothetical protein
MNKIGRNDKCICGSGIKYKKCCMENMKKSKYNMGQEYSSDIIYPILTRLREELPEHVVIDITDDLSVDTYKEYQLKNMKGNVVMVAEKTEANKEVFKTRVNSEDSNIIVMYHGSFRTFSADTFEGVLSSILSFIV